MPASQALTVSLLLALFAVGGGSSVASAQALVICDIGGPGTTEQARPGVEKFLRHIEREAGLTAGSLRGEYHTTAAACRAYVERERPLLGTFDLATYLNRSAPWKLRALAHMGPRDARRYHVLVRDGSFRNLAALQGAKVVSMLGRDLRFVSRIVLAGKVDAATHFEHASTSRPLKGLRDVARGKADATLVGGAVIAHLDEVDLPAKLVSIFDSEGMPGLTMAVLGGNVGGQEALVEKVTAAVPRLCAGDGRDLCKTFDVTEFHPADAAYYRKLGERYAE